MQLLNGIKWRKVDGLISAEGRETKLMAQPLKPQKAVTLEFSPPFIYMWYRTKCNHFCWRILPWSLIWLNFEIVKLCLREGMGLTSYSGYIVYIYVCLLQNNTSSKRGRDAVSAMTLKGEITMNTVFQKKLYNQAMLAIT